MNMIIFCIAIIGIVLTCYTIVNECDCVTCYDDDCIVITLKKKNIELEEKKEIISRIRMGDYTDIYDIVDNMIIN